MGYLKFNSNPDVIIPANSIYISANVVGFTAKTEIKIPKDTGGFSYYNDAKCKKRIKNCSKYTTIYREIDGGYEWSNDESVYVANPYDGPWPEVARKEV